MHPNMSLQELCDIYGRLSVAAGKQSKSELARRYAVLARDYAVRCGDLAKEFSARNNIIASDGEMGRLAQARQDLDELASLAESVGNLRAMAIAQINLTHACRLQGDMPAAVRAANGCIAYFTTNYESTPLVNACINAAWICLDIGRFKPARTLRRRHETIDEKDRAVRMTVTAEVFCAELDSLEGQVDESLRRLAAFLPRFKDLRRLLEGEVVLPARILRRAGQLKQAQQYLDEVAAASWLGVCDPPFIVEEGARVAAAAKDWRAARGLRRQANRLFSQFGMERRCTEDPALECGQLFKPPSREKLIVV
jgi:hypothetical protein